MSKLVLFDFDGTLADTAPDLAAAANLQRTRQGLAPLQPETLRPFASHGARGLLKMALNITPEHPDYETHRIQFLEDYKQDMFSRTTLFSGIDILLATLKQHGYEWGIVTNKMASLAVPIIAHLGLAQECVVTVGGDTTPHSKPHPAPLLFAAEQARFQPGDCIYIGDDLRDIVAGKAAGMATVVAAYGYCGQDTLLSDWKADAIAQTPDDIWPLVKNWAAGF
jgi:2-phosphoglycolate phosphatase